MRLASRRWRRVCHQLRWKWPPSRGSPTQLRHFRLDLFGAHGRADGKGMKLLTRHSNFRSVFLASTTPFFTQNVPTAGARARRNNLRMRKRKHYIIMWLACMCALHSTVSLYLRTGRRVRLRTVNILHSSIRPFLFSPCLWSKVCSHLPWRRAPPILAI